MKKTIAVIVLILMLVNLTGCILPFRSHKNDHTESPTKAPTGEQTLAPTAPPAPDATPTPVPPKIDADLAFDELANELFVSMLTENGLLYHQYVADPGSFGIDESDVERGWGSLSYEGHLESLKELEDLKSRLLAIDASKLTGGNVAAYKLLLFLSERSASLADYYYYSEPLKPFNGDHTAIPLMLVLYEISNEEDAENYLLLLESTDDYLADIEKFEIEKADRGLFMTENALNQVLASCKSFASTGSGCFLIDYFDDALDKIDIAADKKAELSKRSKDCVLNEILPAYTRLAETLDSLRSKASPFVGAKQRGQEALDYFVNRIRSDAAVDETPEQMAEVLNSTIEELTMAMMMLVVTDPDAITGLYDVKFTSGDPNKDNAYLCEIIKDIYPSIPDQTISFVDIPNAIAGDFSPAAYLLSAYDNPKRNIVLFNPTADQSDLLFTLAHECFPGHLYQTQYFRASETIPKIQQISAPSGYSEGWAVFSELMVAERAEKYNANAALLSQYNGIIYNKLIPCYISLKVNTEGWTKDNISNYLANYGLDVEALIDILYEYAVDVPTYFFDYAMGFVNTYRVYKKAAPETDAEYLEFITKYLELGPCNFEVLFEAFGVAD